MGGGGSAGLLLEFAPWWRLRLDASRRRYPLGDAAARRRPTVLHSFVPTRALELRLHAARESPRLEAGAALN